MQGDMVTTSDLSKYTIDSACTILSALKKMDRHSLRNLIVISENKVVGILTDGDIRRAIIRGLGTNNFVGEAMKTPFIFLKEKDSPQQIIETFQKEFISIAPVLDDDNHLKNIMTRKIFEELLLSDNQLTTSYCLDDYENLKLEYPISSRPWGYYKTMVLNEMFQSKIIYLLPKQSLSLQSHKRREEHWTIISGSGSIQLDESKRLTYPGDVIYIPKGCKHRITNESDCKLLIFSEIQLGDYFGEDDIQRYEDLYGRC